MIQEIVTRRYLRIQTENYPYDRAQSLPDLIVIDGGKGQSNCAIDALHKVWLRNTRVYRLKRKMSISIIQVLSILSSFLEIVELKALQYIRDEAHRFGLAYNRNLRRIKTTNL